METATNDSLRIAIGQLYGMKWQEALKLQEVLNQLTLDIYYPFFLSHFRDRGTPEDYEARRTSTEFSYILSTSIRLHPLIEENLAGVSERIRVLIAKIDAELSRLK